MKFKVIVKLNSSRQRLGTKGPNQPKVVHKSQKDTREVDMMKKATGVKKGSEGSKVKSSSNEKTYKADPIDKEPKDYFSNQGMSRATILYKSESDSLLDLDWDFLNDLSCGLYCLDGLINPKLAREKYSKAKAAVATQVFGEGMMNAKVSQSLYIEYQTELAKHTIEWVRHEVNIFIYSEDEFPGSTYDDNRGIWVLKSSTKGLYTSDFLSPGEVEYITDLRFNENGHDVIYGANTPKVAEIVNKKLIIRNLKDEETYSDFEGIKLDLSRL